LVHLVGAFLDLDKARIRRQHGGIPGLQLATHHLRVELGDALHDIQVCTGKILGLPPLVIDVTSQMTVGVSQFVGCNDNRKLFNRDTEDSCDETDDHPVKMYFGHPEEIGAKNILFDRAAVCEFRSREECSAGARKTLLPL
jgi:hypothetical protein